MKKIFLLLILIIIAHSLFSQCYVKNTTFKKGESLSYNVYYKLGFVWVKAATVKFEVLKDKTSEAYHFLGIGKTLNSYKWLYNVSDKYESFADTASLQPLSFSKRKKENSYTSNVDYIFNNEKHTIHIKSNNSKGRNVNKEVKNVNCARDILTTMYYARNLDFNYTKNQKLYFQVIHDGQVSKLEAVFEGFETAKFNGEKIDCYKFSSVLPAGSMFGSNGEITVWVSNDKNKIPVKVKADIIIGTVVVELQEVNNLCYPSF